MSLRDTLLHLAGKDRFHLDDRIGTGYLLGLCWKYGWMMVRGKCLALGRPAVSGSVFVGKKVRILEKRRLTLGAKTRLQDGVYIDALSTDGVTVGNQCVLGRNCRIECTGSLEHLGRGVRIGDRTCFGADCFFGAAGGITIGSDVIAGQNVRFHSENHRFDDPDLPIRQQGVTHRGITVGNNCWIGAGAVFLDGAALGDGCVVGANAVVTKAFPANSVIAGVPAKVLQMRGSRHE